MAPVSSQGSIISKVIMPTPPIPLRASQIVQCTYNPQAPSLTRTYSVHDLSTASQPQGLSVPTLPPYDYCTDKDGDMEHSDGHDNFPSQHAELLEVDEISPNEDRRTAEVALYAPEQGSQSQGVSSHPTGSRVSTLESDEQDTQALDTVHPSDSQIDPVLLANLEQHYSKDSDIQQPSAVITISMPSQNITGSVAQGSQPCAEPTVSQMIALTTTDSELTGHPTKLRSYPNKFREVIKQAKLIVQCNSVTKNPFPPHSTFLDILSREIFSEALIKCMDTPTGYWPNYCSQLSILLWESLMTWQSTIKAKAHEILPWFYDIGTHFSEVENQSQSLELIKGAAFLRDGIDNKGLMNNMAHPALVALVMDFFYAPSSIGSAFPEVFSHEVPQVTLQAALDKYIQTGIQQDHQFKYGTYSKIFAGFLDMQHQIDQHPKHAVKTQELQAAWASAGKMKTQPQSVIAFSNEFCIILD
ncbi:hypothetical protein BKA83DRAFT_4501114 [Pisolithus microcarpus]|nr:hypothetical protein BKA83DRAFT_4501114 [Pisolithus microcarpus]